MTHGGKRPGAGRKPAPPETKKIAYTTKLSPIVVEYLRQHENAAQAIERAVVGSKEFREWRKSVE